MNKFSAEPAGFLCEKIRSKGLLWALARRSNTRTSRQPGLKYDSLVTAIVEFHGCAQAGASNAVNRHLVVRNWLIGAYVVEYEQNGEDRAAYGAKLLANLARDLRSRDVPGCSAEMLGRMRLVYRTCPQLGAQIPSSALTEFRRLTGSMPPAEISSSVMTKSMWKSEVAAADENPPIGLLLCSNKDQVKVKYATGGLDDQLFVSRYLVALPKPEQLQQLIEYDRAIWEQRH